MPNPHKSNSQPKPRPSLDRAMRMMRLDRITPHPRNSKEHDPEQVALLAGLIERYGWTRPILIDERRQIVAGHGARLAALRLGLTHVPVVTLDGLTEQQVREYMIADNKSAEASTWRNDVLRIELGELKALKVDLPALGFDQSELDRLLGELPPPEVPAATTHVDVTIECPRCRYRFKRP